MPNVLIEVTTFLLGGGVGREEFLTADKKVQETLNSAPGFVRRTTAEGDDGWLVVTTWSDAAHADAGAALVAGHDLARLIVDTVTRRYIDIGG